jgi:hypothetical protein
MPTLRDVARPACLRLLAALLCALVCATPAHALGRQRYVEFTDAPGSLPTGHGRRRRADLPFLKLRARPAAAEVTPSPPRRKT